MCWRPEYLLKGFLKSETERGLKWRNEGFCMRQLSFTQTKLPRKTIPKKSLFWPMVSEFWSVVTNLYRCGPMKADDHGSECMWQRGLFTSGRRKQGREGKESREPTSWGFYYLTPPPYVSYQTFSSWPLGDISDPNSLSFMSYIVQKHILSTFKGLQSLNRSSVAQVSSKNQGKLLAVNPVNLIF